MKDDDFGGLTASEQQKRMYFALMRKLGYSGEVAKLKLRAKLGLDSFANVTTDQLTPIIDKLKEKVKNAKQN